MDRPLILVSNDDGINAKGIRTLIKLMNKLGDVYVVAPDSPKSGMGHAITINSTISCKRVIIDQGPQIEYESSGTPADCVKLAINKLLERKPDLCVSGINHGSNSSINVIYSGTMSVAIEAALTGISSIGFSLLDNSEDANFEESEEYILKICRDILNNNLQKGICLNVNIPRTKLNKKIKGIRICKQARGDWKEVFTEINSVNDKINYQLSGNFINYDTDINTDEWALNNHYISIVPVQFDLTAYDCISKLNKLFTDE